MLREGSWASRELKMSVTCTERPSQGLPSVDRAINLQNCHPPLSPLHSGNPKGIIHQTANYTAGSQSASLRSIQKNQGSKKFIAMYC